MRQAVAIALLVAAGLATSSCTVAKKQPPGAASLPSAVYIVTVRNAAGKWVCTAFPKTVVIDYPTSSTFEDQVTWHRHGDDSGNVDFKLKNAGDKSLFPDFEKPMLDGKREKKSGKPQSVPSPGHMVGYTINWKGADCDPDICIRKNNTGCDVYLDQK